MLNKKKQDIFFDLDHTIWDFDKNAEETLDELYYRYKFDQLFQQKTSARFIETYTVNNHRLWNLYHHGQITKQNYVQPVLQTHFALWTSTPPCFRRLSRKSTYRSVHRKPTFSPTHTRHCAICRIDTTYILFRMALKNPVR